MKITMEQIRRAVTQVIQPMGRGKFVSKTGLRAELTEVIPHGGHKGYVDTSPFGFNSKPGGNTFAYIFNLNGDRLAPITIAHQHNSRPEPSTDGGSIIYGTTTDGKTVKCFAEFFSDGKIKIKSVDGSQVELTPDGKITIGSTGSSEPLVLGSVFSTFFNVHKHIGNLGILTGDPTIPMSASEVSAKVFTEL